MRVVSLLPSATEIVYALGLSDQLVGVTFECDYPPDPRTGRSVVVGGLDTHGLDAAQIDALVRAKVASGEVMYTLDIESFRRLDPDVVLTQDLCRVSALPSATVDEALATLGCAADVVTLDPHTIAEIFDGISAVGRATATEAEAVTLVASLQTRLDAVAQSVAGRPRPRVFVLEWPDPPFLAGHWVPELVHLAGGEAVLARGGERSVPTTWEAIRDADPDIVVVASCGFDTTGTAAHAAEMMTQMPTRAAVWAIDANGLMVRPGPRVVDGVETLSSIFHGTAPTPEDLARRVRPAST